MRNPSIGLVLDASLAQRIGPGLMKHFTAERNFWFADVYRPVEELREIVARRRPAGLITRYVPGITEALAEFEVPIAAFSAYTANPWVRCFDVDNAAIGRMAGDYFVNRGFRSFAYVGTSSPFSDMRYEAFAATVRRAGAACPRFTESMKLWSRYLEFCPPEEDQLAPWLAPLPKPLAVLAAHDKIAFLVAESCRSARLRVPEDVVILGVNNDEFYCEMSAPPLSSVRVPWDRVGAEASRLLEAWLKRPGGRNAPPPALVAPEGVATRQSTDLIAVPSMPVARALGVIQRRAAEPFTVKDLVGELRCSRRKLELEFQAHLGRTPRQELVRFRTERARELLIQTELPISCVAERCGYVYTERFCIAFKRTTGCTPLAFRRRHRVRL